MFRKFSEWAMEYAIKLGYIKKMNRKNIHGLDLIMSIICTDIIMLAIGLIMKMIPQVIIFGFMYKFIRKYVGGYHCDSALTCLISSSTMCLCVLIAIKYLRITLAYT